MMLNDAIEFEESSIYSETNTFECRAILLAEEDGGFSIFATRLPGVHSQGDTREEAIHNISEAFAGAIESYRALGIPVPWREPSASNAAGEELWILVNV